MANVMISARVPEDELERAQEVLKANGMTTSGLVRAIIEYVSQTGEVPDLHERIEEARKRERLSRLSAAIEYIGSKPLTGISADAVEVVVREGESYGL